MEKTATQVKLDGEMALLQLEMEIRNQACYFPLPSAIPKPMFEVLKNRVKDETNPPTVKYIYDKKNFNFGDFSDDEDVLMKKFSDDEDVLMKKYGNPKIKEFNEILDLNSSHSIWSEPALPLLGTIPAHEWVPIELPLYVGQKHDSEVMELMRQIYNHHGDDDTGSLYRIQDAFDGFVNVHDTHIRAGSDNGVHTSEFQFWLKLPSENHANILSSWPRDNSVIGGSCVTIHVTARISSLFFIGYDLEQSDCGTPLRLKLHIKCQHGHANHVENVLAPLLKENGTFYVIGVTDLNGGAVETFEINKLGFIDALSGQEQILLN